MILAQQIDVLLDFLEQHPELALGHVNRSAEARSLSTRLWHQCANLLNSVSTDGAQKSWSMWRTFYADFKSRLMRRIKLNRQQLIATGGGPNKKMNLTSQQERLLNLLGEDVGDPIPGVRHSPPQLNEQAASAVPSIDGSIDGDLVLLSESTHQNLLDSHQATPAVEPTVGATLTEVQSSPRVRSRTSRRRRPRRVDTSGSPSALASARELFNDVGRLGAEATMELSRSNQQLAEAIRSSSELLAGAIDRMTAAIENSSAIQR